MTLWIALGLLAGLLAVQTIRAWWYRRMYRKSQAARLSLCGIIKERQQTIYALGNENFELKKALGCNDYWPAEIE